MAWTYQDWPSQSTPAAELARLNLFISELMGAVGKEVDADGKHVSSSEIRAMLDTMMAERTRLQARGGRAIGGGVSVAGFGSTST